MLDYRLSMAALAVAVVTMALPAHAGSPCCCAAPPCLAPAAPMVVYRPYELPPVYIVNQGPVYGGPGIYTKPEIEVLRPMPVYPYVAYDYPVYRDAYAPMSQYYHHRQTHRMPRRTLRRPPGWFDK
jgi:hypothetical protein